MVRRLSVAAALWLLSAAGPAQAMGLGDIKVKSSLNPAFSASIPFTSLSPEEAANVRARLADNEAFQRAGLDRSSYVGSIRVEALTEGPNPRLELSSKELAREPLIVLLVEVRTPGGTRVLREYTVLLDPAVTPATLNQPAASSDFFQTPEERGTQVFAVGQQIDRIAGRSPEEHLDEERRAEERQREPSGAEPDLDGEARHRAVAREVAGRLDRLAHCICQSRIHVKK